MLLLWFGSLSKSRSLDLGHAVSAVALVIAVSFNSHPAFAQISTDPLPIGVIDHVSGKWLRAQDEQPLFRGDLLYEGDTVTIGRDIKKGKLVVVFFAGGAALGENMLRCRTLFWNASSYTAGRARGKFLEFPFQLFQIRSKTAVGIDLRS